MRVFPYSHVCPLAVEHNPSRCSDSADKPNDACNACRAELRGEMGKAMQEGNASFFKMLFVGHVLEREGFIGAADEDSGIQLERAQGDLRECPGDCAIGALSPILGGGYRLFIAIDDDHEVMEVFDSLEEMTGRYFDYKDLIEELAKGERPKR